MEETLRKIIDPNNEACCDYHLMVKCKEWALEQGYELRSGFEYADDNKGCYYCDFKKIKKQIDFYECDYYIADSEQLAVFDACMCILENKDKQ